MKTFSLFIALLLATRAFAEDSIVVRATFDDWQWLPITPSMADKGRAFVKVGTPLNYEFRGPLFRVPIGFLEPAGRMVEGSEAFKGKSALFEPVAGDIISGLTRPFKNLLSPHRHYTFSITLKGKGTFRFRATISGTDPTTGKTRLLGQPDLISIAVTDDWKTHLGTFEVPDLSKPPFRMEDPVSAAICITKGDRVFVDELEIALIHSSSK